MNTPANLKYTKTDEWFDPASSRAQACSRVTS